MPIDLAKAVGGGGGPALGQCIYMPDAATPIVSIGGQQFLMSGHRLVDEAAAYPEVFASFAGPDLGPLVKTKFTPSISAGKAIYANNLFVILSATTSSTVAMSSDGIEWTTGTLPASAQWVGIAYGNNTFVAVSSSAGAGGVSTSTNGATWASRTPPSANLGDVAFGAGLFVAVLSGGTAVYTSPDGITWTPRSVGLTYSSTAIAYGNGKFVAVTGSTSNNSDVVITSSDGITWQSSKLPSLASWSNIVYGNGVFVAVAANENICAVSSDGVTWTRYSLPVIGTWISGRLAFGGGMFVLVGPSDVFVTSTDGRNWTLRTSPFINLSLGGIVYGNNKFVAANSSAGSVGIVAQIVQGVGIPDYKTDGPTTLYMRIK